MQQIDLYNLYLPDTIIDTLSIEDQITHHKHCYDHWFGFDEDMAFSHKIALRDLMDQEDLTLYL